MSIDYARMNREQPALTAALTRAVRSKDRVAVVLAVRKALKAWDAAGGVWPDQWHRWNIALQDAVGWGAGALDIDTLDRMSDAEVAVYTQAMRENEER